MWKKVGGLAVLTGASGGALLWAIGVGKGEAQLIRCEGKAANGAGEQKFDVVFVHGLMGDQNTWKGTNRTFPQALMEDKRLEDGQCWYYTHPSPLVPLFYRMNAEKRAEHMATALRQEGIGTQRPVIFVCHSLGGIIVKNALCLSERNAYKDPLSDRTVGIAFLGTPHKGSWWAKIVRLLLANRDPKNEKGECVEPSVGVAYDLTPNATLLYDEFREMLSKQKSRIGVLSLYETVRTAGVLMVVPEASGSLDGSQSVGVDRSHTAICKPQGGAKSSSPSDKKSLGSSDVTPESSVSESENDFVVKTIQQFVAECSTIPIRQRVSLSVETFAHISDDPFKNQFLDRKITATKEECPTASAFHEKLVKELFPWGKDPMRIAARGHCLQSMWVALGKFLPPGPIVDLVNIPPKDGVPKRYPDCLALSDTKPLGSGLRLKLCNVDFQQESATKPTSERPQVYVLFLNLNETYSFKLTSNQDNKRALLDVAAKYGPVTRVLETRLERDGQPVNLFNAQDFPALARDLHTIINREVPDNAQLVVATSAADVLCLRLGASVRRQALLVANHFRGTYSPALYYEHLATSPSSEALQD